MLPKRHGWLVRKLLVAVFLLSAVMGASLRAQYDLTVHMTSFLAAHGGQVFGLRVANAWTGENIDEFFLDEIVTDSFTVSFEKILNGGYVYYIDAYADYNNNKRYDVPPDDHAWRIVVEKVLSDTTITLMHTSSWVDVNFYEDVEPLDHCDCDIDGDGVSDVGDVLEWVNMVRDGQDDTCLDYYRDGRLMLDDLVELMISVRKGGCTDQ